MKILVTGGAGFIGSAVVRQIIGLGHHQVVNLDKRTYTGNLQPLQKVSASPIYQFAAIDICNQALVLAELPRLLPDVVIHLAAESQFDRSIDGSSASIQIIIVGTYHLLQTCRQYWLSLEPVKKAQFSLQQVSNDEVFRDFHGTDDFFSETTPYVPCSRFSASKAACDHQVRAWHRTSGLPVILTNCSNSYGHSHFPQKQLSLVILSTQAGKPSPVSGNGRQVSDWLYVEAHAALYCRKTRGVIGETYNIGGRNEKQNIEVTEASYAVLAELAPQHFGNIRQHCELIQFGQDRTGHDHSRASIGRGLGWRKARTKQFLKADLDLLPQLSR